MKRSVGLVLDERFKLHETAGGHPEMAARGAAAAKKVAAGDLSSAFCAVRPPGHHAERDRSMGFCLYANVALGVDAVRRECGIDRVLVLDWDVHHGNGTQHIFDTDPSVL